MKQNDNPFPSHARRYIFKNMSCISICIVFSLIFVEITNLCRLCKKKVSRIHKFVVNMILSIQDVLLNNGIYKNWCSVNIVETTVYSIY